MNLLRKFDQVIKLSFVSKRLVHSNQQILNHRCRIFDEEQNEQLKEIERTEKIQVLVEEPGKSCTLIMNKGLSTPYSCSLHMSELFSKRSVLAKVDEKLWDMHRPLEDDCELRFLHFKDENPRDVNIAYWRSCSFILGYVLETSFKDDFLIELINSTMPKIENGSFAYDANLNLGEWKPSKSDLRCLSIGATQLAGRNLKFERLKITMDKAREMFKFNKYKLKHLENMAIKRSDSNVYRKDVTVYKVGEFVDLSDGPMIGDTSLIGRFSLTNIFDVESSKFGKIQRTQGISIPSQLHLHSWTFNLLAERAGRPSSYSDVQEESARSTAESVTEST